MLEVLRAVEKSVGRPLPITYGGRRAGDSPKVVANADRVRQILNWQPKWNDLDTIVAHALAWEDSLRRRNQR